MPDDGSDGENSPSSRLAARLRDRAKITRKIINAMPAAPTPTMIQAQNGTASMSVSPPPLLTVDIPTIGPGSTTLDSDVVSDDDVSNVAPLSVDVDVELSSPTAAVFVESGDSVSGETRPIDTDEENDIDDVVICTISDGVGALVGIGDGVGGGTQGAGVGGGMGNGVDAGVGVKI